MTRLLEINLGELLFPWPPKLHFHYLLRNAGQTAAIVSFTQTSIRATVRVNMQWMLWLPLIILGFINHTLAGGHLASEKKIAVSRMDWVKFVIYLLGLQFHFFSPVISLSNVTEKLKAGSEISSVHLELIHLRRLKYRKMTVNHRG